LQVTSIEELEKILGDLGIVATQLALGDPNHASWKEGDRLIGVARAAEFDITGTMIGFPGEDYTSPQSIHKTGGFGPADRRQERLKIFKWAVDRTAELGVKILTTHVGYIPDIRDPDRTPFLDCLGEAVDYANDKQIILSMETGQETAELLRRTIDEMEAPNLKVNFDPANMILYNRGDPIRALEVLESDIIHVHVKDARYPKVNGVWGEEVPLGKGQVNMQSFLDALIRIGYRGPLVIEREVGTQAERIADVETGARVLKKLLAAMF
jgi:sugar phosphate isomerase/epimerase